MNKHAKPLVGVSLAGVLAGFIAVASGQAVSNADRSTPALHITSDDFIRSDRFLKGKPEVDVLNADIGFQWIDQGDTFFYRSQRSGETRYLLVQSKTGKRTPLFDHQAMATALSRALSTSVDARFLPIDHLTRLGGDRYEVASGTKTLDCDLKAPSCSERQSAKDEPAATPSPDGRYALFLRDYNLWIKDNASGQQRAVTTDGIRAWSYARPPESNLFEITDRRSGKPPATAALWSKQRHRFVSYRLDERHVAQLALVQAVPEDGSFRPKLHTYHYDVVGERPPEAALFIYDVETNQRIPIDYRALPATARVPLIIGHLWWNDDGSKLYVLDAPLTRPFMKLMEVAAATGAARLLVEERADTTLFPNASRTGPPSMHVLRNGDVIWFSERSGWGHLYLYDGKSGKLKSAITRGEWLVRDIQRIDERSGYIYLSGSGRERGEDIYNRHLYRVKLDGTGFKLLTPEPGDHDFQSIVPPEVAVMRDAGQYSFHVPRISPNGRYFIDHFSTVAAPGQWLLRRTDGTLIAKLEDEDPSPLPPYTAPEPIVVKSADGRYDLYGVLSKPASFDPGRKYPVIDHIYPGPQRIKAPKTFASGSAIISDGAILGAAQALADLGFVVIQVDGRGGAFRSKAFRDLSYRNMDKAGMLEDHIAALKQLAQTRPWLDLDRVGIFGNSGGGFATAHALIDYPDFFKVGVSSAGNHEQRAYLRIWGETFHGPPDSTDYGKVFTGRDVSGFKGKLLLAHGEMDDNVHPANTMRLADALIKGNKQFDMLIMPNANHGIDSIPYFQRITQNYFIKHLMGAQLPSEADIVLPGAASPKSQRAP